MEYKNQYTKKDIKELYDWFDNNEYENEVDLGHGLYVKNVKLMIEGSRHVAEEKYDSKTYSGQFHKLFMLRDELIKQGKVKGDSEKR